ncbi:MAG: hypothetical protein ACHWZW_04605 [Spirulina sp.]
MPILSNVACNGRAIPVLPPGLNTSVHPAFEEVRRRKERAD